MKNIRPQSEVVTTLLHKSCRQMSKKLLLSSLLLILFNLNSFSQSLTPCTTAVSLSHFGVEADLYANYPAALAVDDWFLGANSGTGIGVIGQTAATAKPPYAISAADFRTLIQSAATLAGRNKKYEQRMAVPFGTLSGN